LKTILGLIAIALFAYLGATLFRISRLPLTVRTIISSGISYLILGFLLGPQATEMLSYDDIAELDVVINLGVGWVGLLFGLQFYGRNLKRISLRSYLGIGLESMTTFVLVGLGMWFAVSSSSLAGPAWLTVVVLAIIGSTTSPTIGAEVINQLQPSGKVTDMVRLFSSIDATLAIVLLGSILCFSPLHASGSGLLASGWIWFLVLVILGFILGVLFHLLTLYRYTDNQLFVISLGLVVFCGGVAHYLLISPLLLNFIVGIVVANRSPQYLRVLNSLLSIEKPLYFVLLTIAGAIWTIPPISLLCLAPVFVLLRFFGKLIGGALASVVCQLETKGIWGIGPGLMPHGGMALVIALHIKQFFPGHLGDLVLSASILSILVTTLISPKLLSQLFINENEVS
jgi:hypothetical protein